MRRTASSMVAALTLAACGYGLTDSTRISDSVGTPSHPYQRIAVVAMSPSKAERQLFDDALVARLTAYGTGAIVGDRFIEDAAAANGIAPMDAMRAAHADAVLYIWLRTDGDSASGSVPRMAVPDDSRKSWYMPGQNVPNAMATFEARLYDVETQGLAWSGTTTTFYPKSMAADAPPAAAAIAGALAKRGFLAGAH
jgi:hypothetical protein